MAKKYNRLILAASSLILMGLLVAVFVTTPEAIGPFGLTVWFAGLMVSLTGFLLVILMKWRYGENREGFLRALRRSFLISMWLVALLALGSLRQLGIRDIILLTVLGLLIDFYMQRAQR